MEWEGENMALAEQVDQLEAVLDGGWRMPGTGRLLIDRTLMLELIDQLRVAVPEQVQAAQHVLQRRDRVLAQAKAEADAIVAEARRQAQRRLTEDVSVQAAARRAAHIEAQAWRTAEDVERQTDQTAAEWLRSLHARLEEVDRLLAQPLPSSAQADAPRHQASAARNQPSVPRNDASAARNEASAAAPVDVSVPGTRARRAA